jgi:prevent-host-death family protein
MARPLMISEEIGEFERHAPGALRRLRESGQPVVLTSGGQPAAVLLTPEEFGRLTEQHRFQRALDEGLADAAAGRFIEDDDLDREMDREFGPLDRP